MYKLTKNRYISYLSCPTCNSKLSTITYSRGYGITSCGIHNFPIVNDILYFIDNRLAAKSLNLIRTGHNFRALITIADTRLKLLIPILFLLNKRINISFVSFVKILNLFGYDKGWSRYLLHRKEMNSYKVAKRLSKYIKKNDLVFDFGCGVGQILPLIIKKAGAKNTFALDSSFLNLLIAQKYFVKSNTNLICSSREDKFPFMNNSFDVIQAADSFHYVGDKSSFVNECYRILKINGKFMVIQTLNSHGVVFGNIKGANTNKVFKILSGANFKTINIFSDKEILGKKTIKLSKKYISNNIHVKEPFTFFATK